MLALLLSPLLALLSLLTVRTDGPGDGGGDDDDGRKGDDEGEPKGKDATRVAFTADQQIEVNRLIAREKRDAATKARADAKAERDAADETARKAREAEAAKAAGDFEQVEQGLRADLDAATADRDALTAERDGLRAFFDGQIDAALKTLPDALKDFDPGPDAPFAQRKDWLEKALKRAGQMETRGGRGNGPDPTPSGGGAKAPTLEQTKREMAGLFGMSR